MGIREVVKNKLITLFERRYEERLAAKMGSYADWLAKESARAKKSVLTRSDENVTCAQVCLIQTAEGVPEKYAMAIFEDYFTKNPEKVIAYSDECAGNVPWFKPEWSPDTFLSSFYAGGLVAVRKSWLEERYGSDLQEEAYCPQKKSDLMKLLVSLTEAAGGFQKGCRSIGHVPYVVFHRAAKIQQENPVKCENEQRVSYTVPVNRNKDGVGKVPGMVSVIIPSKDHSQILKQCLRALFLTVGDYPLEVIIVDNGSHAQNRREVEEFLDNTPIPCTYLYHPMEFNFSQMCNLGAARATGDLLLFLNDDVEVCGEDWLSKMASKASADYVGAVGMKLYYPGGCQIQHAGIVNLATGPSHILQFLTDDKDYYYGYNHMDRNVLAVTGACLMIQKKKFLEAGGMREELRVTFNDVDLCMTLWELGYSNVVLNSIYAYHHESLSRGSDESGEKYVRLVSEREKLYQRHPELREYDPYYPAGLDRDGKDTAIRPAYLTCNNHIQLADGGNCRIDLQKYRRDDCLMLRVEQCNERGIRGYGVVLGDHNACYQKTLLLWELPARDKSHEAQPKEDSQVQPQGQLDEQPQGQILCRCIRVEGQYRPDLIDNMPDQKQVGLSGFWILPPAGEYRIGMTAINQINGTRLINWSGQVLKIPS